MHRLSFFLFLFLILQCDFELFGAGNDRPNVLLIFVDDMGYSEPGCYNPDTDLRTPFIDGLARDGVKCTSGYVTAPQCSPSRAGLLTGYYQNRFGHECNPEQADRNTFGLERSMRTLGDYMKTAGYRTGYIGKWDLGRKREDNPESRGFDYYYGAVVGARSYWPSNDAPLFSHTTRGHDSLVEESLYHTHQLTKGALEFLEDDPTPFFLFVSYTAPHYPFHALEEDIARNKHITNMKRRTYAGMVTALDDDIGIILQKLDDMGQGENTLVFFISDNGAPHYPEYTVGNNLPLRGTKGDLFEGGIRVPYIIRWKSGPLEAGSSYDRPVSSLDVLPTILAVSGSDVQESLPGTNLIPFLGGREQGDPNEVLYWRWRGQRAVRRGDWKWVSHPGDSVTGLFDLASDPQEKQNLLMEKQDLAGELESLWRTWNRRNVAPSWVKPELMDQFAEEYQHEGMMPYKTK